MNFELNQLWDGICLNFAHLTKIFPSMFSDTISCMYPVSVVYITIHPHLGVIDVE